MTEKTIETYLVKQVKQMGGKAIKLNPIGMAGLPDRMVLLPKGIMFFVETKAPGKKARSVQLSVHKQLQKLGFDVYVYVPSHSYRHVAVVTMVSGNKITIEESNWDRSQLTKRTGTAKELRIKGYFRPKKK